MSYENPTTLGEKYALTSRYPAVDSYVTDAAGNRQPFVHGCIVKCAEVDFPASKHFGEEILKWTICVETTCVMSTAKDVQVEPVKPINIGMFVNRFPGAFEEYKKRYGDEDLPERGYYGVSGIHPSLIGEYKPKKVSQSAIAERRAALEKELKRLEAAEAGLGEKHADPGPYDGAEFHVETNETSLDVLQKFPNQAKAVLSNIGIVTVEGLANLSDLLIPDLGPGNWERYRNIAKNYLDRAKHRAPVEEAA